MLGLSKIAPVEGQTVLDVQMKWYVATCRLGLYLPNTFVQVENVPSCLVCEQLNDMQCYTAVDLTAVLTTCTCTVQL